MKRASWLAAALLALYAVRAAYAEPPPPSFPMCCACLGGADAQSSQLPVTVPVIFCVESANVDQLRLADLRCGAASGGLECPDQVAQTANDGGASCAVQLKEMGITCPISGAPTIGQSGLAALTGLLGVLGVVALRRRAAGAR